MFDEKAQRYRWFLLPSEAADILSGHDVPDFSSQLPFCPPAFRAVVGLPPFELEVTKNDGVVYAPVNVNHSDTNIYTEFSQKLVQDWERGYQENPENGSKNTDIKAVCSDATDTLTNEKSNCDSKEKKEKDFLSDSKSSADNLPVCPLTCNTRKRDLQDKGVASSTSSTDCSISKQIKCDKTTKQPLCDIKREDPNSTLLPTKKSVASKWFSPPKAIFTKFLKVCVCTCEFTCKFFSSPEPKTQVSFSDQNLSVIHCRCHKFFTYSSSSPEPLGQFQPKLAQSIHG